MSKFSCGRGSVIIWQHCDIFVLPVLWLTSCFIIVSHMVVKIKINAYNSYVTSLTATGTCVPYGITHCYLPPSRGDIPTSILAN